MPRRGNAPTLVDNFHLETSQLVERHGLLRIGAELSGYSQPALAHYCNRFKSTLN